MFTPAKPGGPVLLQSRRGSLIQERFPDLVRAAAQLPAGLVLDGELAVWHEGRFSFEALQRRAAAGRRTTEVLGAAFPAHYHRLRCAPGRRGGAAAYERRRATLEVLFADRGAGSAVDSVPDDDRSRRRAGVADRMDRRPRSRGHRDQGVGRAVPARLAGVVQGPPTAHHRSHRGGPSPAASPDRRSSPWAGTANTVPCAPSAGPYRCRRRRPARSLATSVWPAPATRGREVRFSSSWGSRAPLEVVLVAPDVVAEVDADTAVDRGAWRHPLRFVRPRLDLAVDDVPLFGEGTLAG
ncbi:ATP-dependent DNA ligase [Streptomyces roseolus]|uniref:ATP-dependent DNA ligase n=1 Tax=Streptomyces roseolus TaxID=67358 RepID=UPI00365FB10F